jgi:cell division GTPase FtsZ
MASIGCTREERSEILAYLREGCPGVSDGLLEDLADNFMFDTPVCLDPADIVACLSFHGTRLVLVSSAKGQGRAEKALSNLMTKAEVEGVNPAFSASALAIIKGNCNVSMKNDYYPVLEILRNSMHPDALICVAWYEFPDMVDELNLTLILSGIAQ